MGTFSRDLLGIPATNRTLYLRYTELVQFEYGKIKTCYIIVDFLDAMNQAGVNPVKKKFRSRWFSDASDNYGRPVLRRHQMMLKLKNLSNLLLICLMS